MAIVGWDPFREFGFVGEGVWAPPVDIYEDGNHALVIKAELPDMTREDIDITVDNGRRTNSSIASSGATGRSAGRSRCRRRWTPRRSAPTIRTAF